MYTVHPVYIRILQLKSFYRKVIYLLVRVYIMVSCPDPPFLQCWIMSQQIIICISCHFDASIMHLIQSCYIIISCQVATHDSKWCYLGKCWLVGLLSRFIVHHSGSSVTNAWNAIMLKLIMLDRTCMTYRPGTSGWNFSYDWKVETRSISSTAPKRAATALTLKPETECWQVGLTRGREIIEHSKTVSISSYITQFKLKYEVGCSQLCREDNHRESTAEGPTDTDTHR